MLAQGPQVENPCHISALWRAPLVTARQKEAALTLSLRGVRLACFQFPVDNTAPFTQIN